MEILHKINHKKNKNQNSQSGSEKNSENANLNNNNNNNEFFQKNANNNDTNFDIGSKKSPSRSIYNQEYYDINSETDKNNLNNINIFLNKFNKAGNNTNIQNFPFYADGTNQTYTDLRSNQGNENNEEYSKNKINQIKNDLLNFKNQIKKELKDEVREEIRNEFSKQMITVNKINNPEIIQLDGDCNFNSNSRKISNYYDDREKRKAYDGKNEAYKKKNYNKTHKGFYKKKGKGRWSSVQKYYYIKNNNNNINNINNTNIIIPDNNCQYDKCSYHKGRKSLDWRDFINHNQNNDDDDGIQLKEQYNEKYEEIANVPNNKDNMSKVSFQNDYINDGNGRNEYYFNDAYRKKNKQEIKKLIRLYNLAKDDKRNKSQIYKNSYDINNNNKSISNYYYNENNNSKIMNDNYNNINTNININDEMKKRNKSKSKNFNISENLYVTKNIGKKNNPINLKNDFIKRYSSNKNVKHSEEEENSNDNDFVKGHRFQIKYQKVKPKGQAYKSSIPKPRISSTQYNFNKKKDNNNINTINNNENNYVNNYNANKTEDCVNFENVNNIKDNGNDSFNKENIDDKDCANNKGDFRIEKTKYSRKNVEITTNYNIYNKSLGNNNKNNGEKNNKSLRDKLSVTGKFIEENNINDNNNNDDVVDIKNFMDKNIIYKESKDKPIISKSEKMEDKNIITTITTETREIYTPDRKKNENKEYVINKKFKKNKINFIKESKTYNKIDNKNNNNAHINNNKKLNDLYEIRSSDGSNAYINNQIKTKNIVFGRKTYDGPMISYNKNNYINIDNSSLKSPNQLNRNYYYQKNQYLDNLEQSPRYNTHLTAKSSPFYRKNNIDSLLNVPYDCAINYQEQISPSNYNHKERLEKKYIKDPEGNLIETYVKKTRYNDGSVLLEYV
jgi:hypothetical protein